MHSRKVCICTKRGRDYTLGWLQLVRWVAKQGKCLDNVLAMQGKHCGICIVNVYRESLVRTWTCITKYCSIHAMHEIQRSFEIKGFFLGYSVVPDAQYTCLYLLLQEEGRPGKKKCASIIVPCHIKTGLGVEWQILGDPFIRTRERTACPCCSLRRQTPPTPSSHHRINIFTQPPNNSPLCMDSQRQKLHTLNQKKSIFCHRQKLHVLLINTHSFLLPS